VAHYVHQAKLYACFGVNGLKGFGEAFQVIEAGNKDVLHAPVLELVDHL